MIGRPTILWLVLAAVSGVVLYQVSYRVAALEVELARVNRQILRERDTIHVLEAEWSYLNDPARLADLVQRHLALQPLTPAQMVAIEDLPLPLPPLTADAGATDGEASQTQ